MPRWLWILTSMMVPATTLLPAASSAATIGWITMVDGSATLARGKDRFVAAEGQRVRADDTIETAEGTQLLRIELDDGKTIDLGPATRITLRPRVGDRETHGGATLALAGGWVKVASPAGAPAALVSPSLDALRVDGTTVIRAGRSESWMFVESGSVEAVSREGGRSSLRQDLAEGDSFVVQPDGLGSVSWLASSKLLAQLPRAFVDTLPRRADRFAGRGDELERDARRLPARKTKVPS